MKCSNRNKWVDYDKALCMCLDDDNIYVGFQVVTAMVMKSFIFRDMTPCSPLKLNWRFDGTCHLSIFKVEE
jgi:hypothetical protein